MANGLPNLSEADVMSIWWGMSPPRSFKEWIKLARMGKSRCERLKKKYDLSTTVNVEAPPADAAPIWEQHGDTATTESSGDARTLEQLATACDVDQDVWYATKLTTNRYADNWQIKAVWQRRVPEADEKAAEWFADRVADIMAGKSRFDRVPVVRPKGECLLEVSIFDLHLGKHCWGPETGGADYDLQIANSLLHDAINYLYDMAPANQIGRVLFPVGNDLFHVDTVQNTTTSGTPQDVDQRWQYIFNTGFETYATAIERIATAVPVDVVIVPGNHDFKTCYHFGHSLKQYFKDHPNVNIDNSPCETKYYRYGKTLIGFNHGQGRAWIKPEEMTARMATDRPQDFSECTERSWHLGHVHKHKSDEAYGVVCEVLPSLTPPDAWHAKQGYVNNRRCAVAIQHHIDGGECARYTYRAR